MIQNCAAYLLAQYRPSFCFKIKMSALVYTHFGDPLGTPINWRDSESISVETLYEYIKKKYCDLDPPHQREIVHDLQWKQGIISSIMGEAPADIPALRWHPVKGGGGRKIRVSLDGKQRLSAIIEFKENNFKWRGKYYKHDNLPSLSPEERTRVDDFKIINKTTNRTLTPEEILNSFNKFQQTQQTRLGERLHAVTGGTLSVEMDKIMDEHKIAINTLFSEKLQKRFHPLEIYVKCFFYFRFGIDVRAENDSIQKMWERQMSADYERPSEHYMHRFATLMRRTLYILCHRKCANVVRKKSKILQIFLLMKWSYPQRALRDEHLEFILENLGELVTNPEYGIVAGNHGAHISRFEYLKGKTQAAEFKDASSGEDGV